MCRVLSRPLSCSFPIRRCRLSSLALLLLPLHSYILCVPTHPLTPSLTLHPLFAGGDRRTMRATPRHNACNLGESPPRQSRRPHSYHARLQLGVPSQSRLADLANVTVA